jgi:superfamily II helicase
MTHTDPEKPATKQLNSRNYPGKITRSDLKRWVKVCPACFSINIQPLTNISGTIVHEQWICSDCNYVGIAIEVNKDDLIRFRRQQISWQYDMNRKITAKNKL